MRNAGREFALVVAVNDDSVLSQNLLRSPWIKEKHVPVLVERGHSSASVAYNTALEKTDADIVVFAHQDVYLPQGWNIRLAEAIKDLERHGERWGVLGVWGIDERGAFCGRVWCGARRCEYRRAESNSSPVRVASIDEIVIVVNRATELTFDAEMPGFHLYATDMALRANKGGFGTFVVEAPVVHNAKPRAGFDRNYSICYRYMQRKWRYQLPLQTCTIPVTRYGLPLIRQRIRTLQNSCLRNAAPESRILDPRQIAKRLEYEHGSS